MISKETLKDILLDQKEYILSEIKYVDRDINLDEYINNNLVTIICGVRRCGKSTLLRIFLNKIIKNNQNITYLYCDFSDERLNKFEIDDFQKLFEIFLETYKDGKKYFFFDEIQSINGWEKFANRMYEKENAKLFITGSNKSLLRSDTSTVLTGRQRLLELYPFSFREFLKIKPNNFNILNLTTKERMKLSNYFEEYFQITGFPYPLEIKDKRTLQEYFN
ncbi:MAG: AAA family ATPase, partial [archaeon]